MAKTHRRELAKQKSLEARIRTLSRQVSVLQEICSEQSARLAWLETRFRTQVGPLPSFTATVKRAPSHPARRLSFGEVDAASRGSTQPRSSVQEGQPKNPENPRSVVDLHREWLPPQTGSNECDVDMSCQAKLTKPSNPQPVEPLEVSEKPATRHEAAMRTDLSPENSIEPVARPGSCEAHIGPTDLPAASSKKPSAKSTKPRIRRITLAIPETVRDVAERLVAKGLATDQNAALEKIMEMGAAQLLREMET